MQRVDICVFGHFSCHACCPGKGFWAYQLPLQLRWSLLSNMPLHWMVYPATCCVPFTAALYCAVLDMRVYAC